MILVTLAGLALNVLSREEPLATWDNAFADFLAMNSRHGAAPAPMTLVEINDATLASKPWPWTPLDFSLFFQAVEPQQPDVVAVDEVLDWNRFALPEDHQRKLPQYEKILHDHILRATKVLLGAELGVPEDAEVIPPLQPVPILRNVKGPIAGVPEYTAIQHEPKEDFRLSTAIGFTNLPPVHARYNSVPLLFSYRGEITPSFTLQAVLLWAKLTPDDVKVELGSRVSLGDKIEIPIDAAGRMRVDFGSPRVSYGLDDLILASEQADAGRTPAIPLEQLKHSVVLLSRTDSDARTLPLAANRNGSPGELFAAAIATIQNQSFIAAVPQWARYAVILAFGIVSYFVPARKKKTAVFMGIVALSVYGLVAMAVFNRWLLWLPFCIPAGMTLFFVLIRVSTPSREKMLKKPIIL